MSDFEIIGEFYEDETVEIQTGVEENSEAKQVRLVFINVDDSAQRIVIDTSIPEDLSDSETMESFCARGHISSRAKAGTYQWFELIVTKENGGQYNEWGDEIAVDDPRINRAIKIHPKGNRAQG